MHCNHSGWRGVKHKGKQRAWTWEQGTQPATVRWGKRAGKEGAVSEKVKSWSMKEAEAEAEAGLNQKPRTHLLRLFLRAHHFLNLIWSPINTTDPMDSVTCFCRGYFDWE